VWHGFLIYGSHSFKTDPALKYSIDPSHLQTHSDMGKHFDHIMLM